MQAKSILRELDKFIPLLTSKQQELILAMVKNILQTEPTGKRISKKQYNVELNESIAQMKSGKTISHSSLKNELDKWQ